MTEQNTAPEPGVPLRDPDSVMRLERLGAFHQCRLSFMRQLTRRMQAERWTFSCDAWQIDANGVGHAVLTARTPNRCYSLVAFAHDLPDEQRSDRVIAEAWDATFALFDGIPDVADIRRLQNNVPRQEAGRVAASELTLSRANRSVRLWEHVISSLAEGQQPDPTMIESVGYLMRTTAVYGSGKFGAADREQLADRDEFRAPFQVEMLTVYLIRWFVRDLVQHMARQRNPDAVKLDPATARRIGIGNSTGLGMAPFIINHPVLFNNWIMARETALSRVRGVRHASDSCQATFLDLLTRSKQLMQQWHSEHELQRVRIAELQVDIARLEQAVAELGLEGLYPWDGLFRWAIDHLCVEAQECLVSLLLEPYPDQVDDLIDDMASDESTLPVIDGSVTLGETGKALESRYGWALTVDWQAREHIARAWYVSAEKLEPRLGERFEEPIAAYEQPLAPARDAASLHQRLHSLLHGGEGLSSWAASTPVAELLLRYPEHRHTVRRLQNLVSHPYAEIRGNTIAAGLLPIDMLRAKLSFFGAVHFDPRSDRWVRICLYANAPYPEQLQDSDADRWPYPSGASACSSLESASGQR